MIFLCKHFIDINRSSLINENLEYMYIYSNWFWLCELKIMIIWQVYIAVYRSMVMTEVWKILRHYRYHCALGALVTVQNLPVYLYIHTSTNNITIFLLLF